MTAWRCSPPPMARSVEVTGPEPDLVFLDVMLPKEERLRGVPGGKAGAGPVDTHVVLLTAKGQAYDREQGMAAGADAYLTKPFDPDELLELARGVVG